jgi:hypothetical protein
MPPKDFDQVVTIDQAQAIAVDCAKYPDVVQPFIVTPDPRPAPAANTVVLRLPGPESINRDQNKRIQFGPAMDANGVTGDDVLLTDVISFEVRPAWIHNPSFNNDAQKFYPSPPPEGMAQGNTDEPFADLPPSAINPNYRNGTFDTWYDAPNFYGVAVDWDNPGGANGFLFVDPANALTMVTKPPHRINVRALQIKVRLWDPKAEQARQATIINEG